MIILLIILILSESTIPYVRASDQNYYARIMQDECYLYRAPIDVSDASNIYFELPKTYFVLLISSPNDEFYEACYMDTVGYVKKNSVQAVTSAPSTPFLENVTFRAYADISCKIYPAPDKSKTPIITMPTLTRNIVYIGKLYGECVIEGRTNIWYYCRYISDKIYDGYVYSDFCDEMSQIIPNTEEVIYTLNPTFSQNPNNETSLNINNNLVGILIGILSIPALIFIFMIIKSKQILTRDSHGKKEIIDYYNLTER
ncbi:MAG: hypothetical protein ACLRFL_01035 [Clostridia bacterium]